MRYESHSEIEFEGFLVVDTSTESRDGTPVECIWVGYGGMKGRWLNSEQVRELARVLERVAAAHEARTA
jgi:hypothetical protein